MTALGSVVGHAAVGGRWTGQGLASRIVHDLLDAADAERWLTLSGHLTLLAEAAPDVFCVACPDFEAGDHTSWTGWQ